MFSTPRISIILPVYNGADYLEACLGSLLAQTLTEFEVIVGDDGSTDGSLALLERYADRRFRIFGGEPNRGLFPNINRLLPHTRAPLVRIFCQDDLLEPTCLAEEVAFFEQHPAIGMSFCKTYRIDATGAVMGRCGLGDMPEVVPPSLSLQLFYYYGCLPGNLSTVVMRREHLERAGPFDSSMHVAADYAMWVRLCAEAPLGVIHQRLVRLRLHARQLSRWSSSGTQFVVENRAIQTWLRARLPERIRGSARRYAHMRQEVLAVHHALRCLLGGRSGELLRTSQALGWRDFLIGSFFWLATANNRLYRPRPRFAPEPGP
jgi:glycosyltransferase involved in cell wall biosynthesis